MKFAVLVAKRWPSDESTALTGMNLIELAGNFEWLAGRGQRAQSGRSINKPDSDHASGQVPRSEEQGGHNRQV